MVVKKVERCHIFEIPEAPYEDLRPRIKNEPVKHLLKTGCRESNHNGYAWIMSTQDHTVFKLTLPRIDKKLLKAY